MCTMNIFMGGKDRGGEQGVSERYLKWGGGGGGTLRNLF